MSVIALANRRDRPDGLHVEDRAARTESGGLAVFPLRLRRGKFALQKSYVILQNVTLKQLRYPAPYNKISGSLSH
jgi:hypothetical protein